MSKTRVALRNQTGKRSAVADSACERSYTHDVCGCLAQNARESHILETLCENGTRGFWEFHILETHHEDLREAQTREKLYKSEPRKSSGVPNP